jgi:PBP/GOBP family
MMNRSQGSFNQQILAKCMKDSNVKNSETLTEILNDDKSSHPEENCLRKCLYVSLGIVNEEGELNVSFNGRNLSSLLIDSRIFRSQQSNMSISFDIYPLLTL